MSDSVKKYTNGEITIVWKPEVCIHSTLCWKGPEGLKQVFNPAEKPWIKPEGAGTDRIINQINKCPSGALSFYYNNESKATADSNPENVIEVTQNGPLLVHGNITVKHKSGEQEKRNRTTAFCRCGHSSNKPYCDGSHSEKGFKG